MRIYQLYIFLKLYCGMRMSAFNSNSISIPPIDNDAQTLVNFRSVGQAALCFDWTPSFPFLEIATATRNHRLLDSQE
jgi:hypothetical protein